MANIKSFSVQSPYDQQMEELKRRQRMAELMQQEAMQPLESQVAPGGMVVPTSPVLGLAKLLQSYMSGKQLRDIEKQRGEREQLEGNKAMNFLQDIRMGQQQPMSADEALGASLSPTPSEPIRVPLSPTERQTRIESAFLGGSPQMKLAAQLASMKPERTLQMDKIDPAKFTPESVALAFKADDPSLLVPVAPKPADEPSILQEYKYAVSQGFNGSLMDYQTALRRAGATNVTNSLGPTMSGVDEQGNPVFFRPSNQGGMPAIIPGVRPESKPLNEGQANAAGFADRLEAADKVLRETPFKPTVGTSIRSSLPFSNQFMGQQQQLVEQAKREFITAQLRRESGASISPGEFETADKQYFPQPGEGPLVIAQKEQARQRAVKNMRRSAGQTAAAIPEGAVRRIR